MSPGKVLKEAENLAIQDRFWGREEPDLDKGLGAILNWYSACAGNRPEDDMRGPDRTARLWLQEYLNAIDRQDEANQLNQVPDKWIPRTAGWLARLGVRGYDLNSGELDSIDNQLKSALTHAGEVDEAEETETRNPHEYVKEAGRDLIAEIEGMIDDGQIDAGFSLYRFLQKREASGKVVGHLIQHLEPIAAELLEAIDTTDPDLREAYSRYNEDQLFEIAATYQALLDEARQYTDVAKKTRKPRTKKAPSTEKLLKHFKYAARNDELKLASIDPRKIIGANELWTFNPKSVTLTVYRANDSEGLKVKRTSIVNINEQTSMAKRVGRKTQERLKEVLEGGKVVLRHVMDNIKGQKKEVSRITSDTILLRVM